MPRVYSLHCRYFQLLETLTVQCNSLFPSQAVRSLVMTSLSSLLPNPPIIIVLQRQRGLFQDSFFPFSLKNLQSNFSHKGSNFSLGRTLPATPGKLPRGLCLADVGLFEFPGKQGPYALRCGKWKHYELEGQEVQTEATVHNC